jgi:hypothetical protein
MTRSWPRVLVLGGTVAFLSCGGSNLGNPNGGGVTTGSGGEPTCATPPTGAAGTTAAAGTGAGGTGGTAGGGAGGGDRLTPCDGVDYFIQEGACAATFAQQVARDVTDRCRYVTVAAGTCCGHQVWTNATLQPGRMADLYTCVYDAAGSLVGARQSSDHNFILTCDGGFTTPTNLEVGRVPSLQGCALTSLCGTVDAGSGG